MDLVKGKLRKMIGKVNNWFNKINEKEDSKKIEEIASNHFQGLVEIMHFFHEITSL